MIQCSGENRYKSDLCMKKNYQFIILILSLVFIGYNTPLFADEEGYNMQQPPAWPMPNTEANINPETVDNTLKANIDKPTQPDGWSGGADLVNEESGTSWTRYSKEEQAASFMPLGTKDMLVDDGSKTLSASIQYGGGFGANKTDREIIEVSLEDEQNKGYAGDEVKDWIAKEGLTLREILQEWAKTEGWEIIWKTPREYPLRASAIFRGRFKDVTSALVRSFSKAAPPPYAKFYLGNRVIVIYTMEDDND